MDDLHILVKCVTLIYREYQLEDNDKSFSIIRNIVQGIKEPEVQMGLAGDREITGNLKSMLMGILEQGDQYVLVKEDFLQTAKLCTGNNERLYKTISDAIETEMTPEGLRRSVISLRKTLMMYQREKQIIKLLGDSNYKLRYQRNQISDMGKFVEEVIGQLEPLATTNVGKDPAVQGEIDFSNKNDIMNMVSEVKNVDNQEGVYRTGWNGFNLMSQGGIRPGELVVINALQHQYKSGFTLSLFAQIAMLNNPKTKDLSKKPLLLRISFEDDLSSNLKFIYQYLKYSETGEPCDIKDIDEDEASAFVMGKLQATGFSIKMLRVDPTQWTYKDVANKVLEYEAEGYNVEILMLDYIYKLPTTGCINTGPMGTDVRDLFRRLRNFCSSKKIALISPHQLNTKVKEIERTQVTSDKLVSYIANRGLTAGSGQLDQEIDLEIYIHKVRVKKEWYLTIQRGKHRNFVTKEDYLHWVLKFPSNLMPIPQDMDEDAPVLRRVPTSGFVNADEELFEI